MFNYCIDVDNNVADNVVEATHMIVENTNIENNGTIDAVENMDTNNIVTVRVINL